MPAPIHVLLSLGVVDTDHHLRPKRVFDWWLAPQVDSRVGPALASLQQLLEVEGPGSFDFAFIGRCDLDLPRFFA